MSPNPIFTALIEKDYQYGHSQDKRPMNDGTNKPQKAGMLKLMSPEEVKAELRGITFAEFTAFAAEHNITGQIKDDLFASVDEAMIERNAAEYIAYRDRLFGTYTNPNKRKKHKPKSK